MSEGADKESQTEDATEKKISDAIEKGNVPASKEAGTFAAMLATLLYFSFLVGDSLHGIIGLLGRFLDDPGGFTLRDGTDATKLLEVLSLETGRALAPFLGMLAVFGIAASFFQNSPRFVADRIEPKLSRLSILSGWGRIMGAKGWAEFGKAVFKISMVTGVVAGLARTDSWRLVNAMFTDPVQLPELTLALTVRLLTAVCIVTVILVVADLMLVRFQWRKDLRMSKQEIKDEHKQAEGDPLVKSRMRSLARDRARRRMIADVPRATIVLANPTHYAIALRYVREEGGAPVVVAKGQDLIALKIREIAESHGIPVVEDKPLVRSMYDSVEIDQQIPPEFYRVVAELLYVFYSDNRKMAGKV
ncbi:EscU/YscU/HrcU family type III secretion system export apparatus switch protein [Salinarimonas soli]|uniref:Flagellar biosynthetic protein FlhB n=1 Tax=Salinarimonas soli TaxID=1638099 RepID=A0A5B2V7B5_9HYPH|nr:EscU/YscU/HrcU family type III secretion system export apparatus switch protein [Salinarimonas soli]KAA2234698.1 flagellar type III secretion system protein FlhB [Salinarimonas soli]